MSLWKWNNAELEIDMEDVEFQEKYEKAFQKMEQTENKLLKTGMLSDYTKAYCQMFHQLFDDLFGEGTSEKLFGGKYHVGAVENAYESFIDHCKQEVNEINKRRAKRVKKYAVINK